MSKIIMGIQLKQRVETAQAVQGVLTQYGCLIKTRLGVHQASEDSCSERGLILIEFLDNKEIEAAKMKEELSAISDVVVKTMEF